MKIQDFLIFSVLIELVFSLIKSNTHLDSNINIPVISPSYLYLSAAINKVGNKISLTYKKYFPFL